jgi:hypothetical protein
MLNSSAEIVDCGLAVVWYMCSPFGFQSITVVCTVRQSKKVVLFHKKKLP